MRVIDARLIGTYYSPEGHDPFCIWHSSTKGYMFEYRSNLDYVFAPNDGTALAIAKTLLLAQIYDAIQDETSEAASGYLWRLFQNVMVQDGRVRREAE